METTLRNEKGTFIIKIQRRENGTWQGEVVWVERKETRFFRSALELLKMIDNAMDVQETEAADQIAAM